MSKNFSDDVFLVGRTPEEANIVALRLLHHVHCKVKGFLLCDKPLVDFKCTDLLGNLLILHVVDLLLLHLDLVNLDEIVL